MNDARVAVYRQAAEALRRGQFDVSIPIGAPDEVSELGEALQALAQTLKAQSEQSTMLAEIAQRVNEGLLIKEVLEHVYRSFFSLIPYDRIGLALLEEGNTVVRAYWAHSEAMEIKLPVGFSAVLAGSSLEGIISTGRPRILNDLEDYLEQHPNSDSTRHIVEEGMRSSLTCPLVAKGQPVGFLFFSSIKKNTYSEAHQELFLQIAGQLAMTLEKGRKNSGIQRAQKLEQLEFRHRGNAVLIGERLEQRFLLDKTLVDQAGSQTIAPAAACGKPGMQLLYRNCPSLNEYLSQQTHVHILQLESEFF